MERFESYKKDLGFEIGSGFSGNSEYMRIQDEKNKRILMEEQYTLVQAQKAEILAQQKYRKEQRKGANFEKRLLIFNTIITTFALLISIIALFK